MTELYRGYEISREKIDSQLRWTVTQAGSAVYVTAKGEDAAMDWIDAYRKGIQWAISAHLSSKVEC